MEDEGDFAEQWEERLAAIRPFLGQEGDRVFHATVPLFLGGQADVVPFPGHCGGIAYCTADLIGDGGQVETALGQYELVICLRQPADWAPSLLSKLAPYTLETAIEPFETMAVGEALSKPTQISALLFLEYGTFRVGGRQCGLLLCVGITEDELAAYHEEKATRFVGLLRDAGVLPFTDLDRQSVLRHAV